jgi:hypothetical protein
MGFKELVSDEVRRIEQALPHSDREVATLSQVLGHRQSQNLSRGRRLKQRLPE